MKKAVIIILIIGAVLLVAGGITFAVGMSKLGWDFKALNNTDYEEQTASFAATEVQEIVVDVDTANVSFVQADDDQITVEYYVVKDKKGNVLRQVVPALADGVLNCKLEEERKASFMSFGFGREENVVVKVPQGKVVVVTLKGTTGNIVFGQEGKERTVYSLSLKGTTGNIELKGTTVCQHNAAIEVTTGNVKFAGQVQCAGDVTVKASTGNVKFNAALTAAKIMVETSTGNVTCTAPLSFDSLAVETSTGNVTVLADGAKEGYAFAYETSTGTCNQPNFVFGGKSIHIKTSTGNINLSFAQ